LRLDNSKAHRRAVYASLLATKVTHCRSLSFLLPRMLPECLQTLINLLVILIQSGRRCTQDPREQLKKRNANIPNQASHKRKEISVAYNPATNASSPLLCKLPLEIRRKIYAYALGQQVIHILLVPHRITHICCTSPTVTDFTRVCCPHAGTSPVPQHVPTPPSKIPVALLRTCRQIYTEALPVLYGLNTFDINDLSAFVFLAAAIPPKGLASMRSLHVLWMADFPPLRDEITKPAFKAPFDDATFLRFWTVLATRMPALRELRMATYHSIWTPTIDVKDEWVQPLKRVKGLDLFELGLVGNHVSQDPACIRRDEVHVEEFTARLRGTVCNKNYNR